MEPEDLQAALEEANAKLEAQQAESAKQAEMLSKYRDQQTEVKRFLAAFQSIKAKDPTLYEYANALAKGEAVANPYEGKNADEDYRDPDETQREEMSALEQRITALINQKFQALGDPLLNLRAESVERNAFDWAVNEMGLTREQWAEFKGSLTQEDSEILTNPRQIQRAVKAWWADKAHDAGYEKAQREQTARQKLAEGLVGPAPAGKGDLDADFEGIDPTDMKAMFDVMERETIRQQFGGA